MKKIINKFIIPLCAGAVFLTSCKKDFMNLQPLDQISSDQTWGDAALAETFVTGVYSGLNVGGFREQMLASLSDESVFTHVGRGINTINEASLSPSNLGWVDESYAWLNMYNNIRGANQAIVNLTSPNSFSNNPTTKERILGESYFLRAYYYQQLVRYYGGVPLIKKLYGLNEDYTVARNTYAECVASIVSDCDSAALLLDGKSMTKGRATKLAAQALKSRVLLYAASPLHDMTYAKGKSNTINAYAKPELLGYVNASDADRTARWTAAKNAALDIINGSSGYKLNLSSPVSASEGRQNYMSISMGGGSTAAGMDASASQELIFARYFIPDEGDNDGNRLGRANGPNGYHNWAGNTPIGLLVDDYEMMDGKAFDWDNPANKANPYANRDPRFYASILYDGADWKPRNLASGDVDPASQIQTGVYDLIDNGKQIVSKGLDTRASAIEDWNGSRSGYYMRKFLDPNPALVDKDAKQFIPWPFFRYTEAVFNYVEASIELGDLGEATKWLNRIRFRAGMPALTVASQNELRDAYRHERRIEMVYEEQRYHDARRWMIAPSTLGRKLTFIDVVGTFKSGKTMAKPYRHDETIFNYTYNPVINTAHEDRKWDDKMYFRPFDRNEVNKNSLLDQNPGYDK